MAIAFCGVISTRSTPRAPSATGSARVRVHPILRPTARAPSAVANQSTLQTEEGTMKLNADVDTIAATILSLERGALDRWNSGDVEGPLEIYSDDVTYFDPITAVRIDGLPAMRDYFRRLYAGQIRIHAARSSTRR
jgi:hypothetical protein